MCFGGQAFADVTIDARRVRLCFEPLPPVLSTMSLLLLRQSLRQCQLSLLKRTGSVAASRFNSTDGERWVSAIKVEDHAPRQPVTNMKEEMEDRWARHSSEFLHQLELAPRNAFTGKLANPGLSCDVNSEFKTVFRQNRGNRRGRHCRRCEEA